MSFPPASDTPIFIDQHAQFQGTTGSGKTYRATYQLMARWRQLQRVPQNEYFIVVVDTKPVPRGFDDAIGNFGVLQKPPFNGHLLHSPLSQFDFNSLTATRVIVYRPEESRRSPDYFSEDFEYLHGLQFRDAKGKVSSLPFLIYLDEIIDVFSSEDTRKEYMIGFSKLMAQGRSSWQTVWVGSQMPVYIDTSILRLCTASFVFRLETEDDRLKMARNLGAPMMRDRIPNKHGFWYVNTASEKYGAPTYYDGVRGRR